MKKSIYYLTCVYEKQFCIKKMALKYKNQWDPLKTPKSGQTKISVWPL